MNKFIITAVLLTQLCCCVTQKEMQTYIGGKYFENPRGPLYSESKIWLNNDSTFKYSGSGPFVSFSQGRWFYDDKMQAIRLITDNKLKPAFHNIIDTMWVYLSGKNIRVLSKTKIMLDDKPYYLTTMVPDI
ncbi:hypothetical protein QEG73_00410 [Chitinophagaceae bacterium 26-R-25]|nr:hypothetical protein [Chitinophagaceae bacterium 26-R-25]